MEDAAHNMAEDDPCAAHAAPTGDFRADGFVRLAIAYGRAAHGGGDHGLTILLHGAALLRGVRIPAWAPLPSWRWGLAARSGPAGADFY